MTPYTLEESIGRVQAMAHDANGEAWALSATDRTALLAVLASRRELLDALTALRRAVVRHGAEADQTEGYAAFDALMAALAAARIVIAKAEGH